MTSPVNSPPPDPVPIPARLAWRAMADVLTGHAAYLASLTPGRSRGRRGGEAAAATSLKRVERLIVSDTLRAQAAECWRRGGLASQTAGRTIDAAVLGYLVALAYGHAAAWPELIAELADLGRPGALDGLSPSDPLPLILARVLGVEE